MSFDRYSVFGFAGLDHLLCRPAVQPLGYRFKPQHLFSEYYPNFLFWPVFILDEKLSLSMLVGGIIVVLGVYGANYYTPQREHDKAKCPQDE